MGQLLRRLAIAALLVGVLIHPAAYAADDTSVSTSVHNFVISDFQIDYYLSKDPEGRSRLKTVERITAEFPDRDQNHGIERVIPNTYDGHPTSLKIEDVTEETYEAQNSSRQTPYTTYESNGNTVVRIGEADTYVHGTKRYEITYTQRDVTHTPDNANISEFYWDTTGGQWQAPIMQLVVRLHVVGGVATALNGDTACYQGLEGGTGTCTITKTLDETTAIFTAQPSTEIAPGENMTLAVGFQAGTFADYQPSLWERLVALWGMLNIAGWVASVVAIIVLIAKSIRLSGRKHEIGTVVPEYLPPRDASVTVSGQIIGTVQSVMTAQLLDLAVRHYVKIYEVKEKTFFSAAQYEIEIIRDISGLRWEEQEILKDMFDNNVAVGTRLNLKQLRNSYGFAKRTANNDSELSKLMQSEYSLRETKPENVRWFRRAALVFVIAGVVMLSLPLLFAALMALVLSFTVHSLTDKGLVLRRYLEGLKMYIGVAEQERLQMLQSPEGAEKVTVVTGGDTDPAQLVKLYERVLPYAVLFGQEKKWSKQLGAYYENIGAQPEWYSGGNSALFNAAVFSSAMNNFSTSTTTYTSSSSSSSSGSGGGGSSGGGGGGGGGGGW